MNILTIDIKRNQIRSYSSQYRVCGNASKKLYVIIQYKWTKIRKPVLLLAGRQDIVVGYQDLLETIEEYPRATFAVLDMAGHNLQIEQPELFQSLVEEWMIRTENISFNDSYEKQQKIR